MLFDVTPPTITCPSNIVIDNDPAICGANYNYQTPVGLDNCISITSLISGLPSGSIFPTGITTNIFQVSDSAGNIATCNFYVLVNDIESPIINCPEDTSLLYNEDCLVTMSKMEDNSVDLIVTSPPYNKGYWSSNRNMKNGFGVILDDLIAGLFTLIVLYICIFFYGQF